MICLIDYRSTSEEKNSLIKLGYDIIQVPKFSKLYSAIDGHVDIQLNILDKAKKLVVINKDIPNSFKLKLIEYGINYIECYSMLEAKYPKNIGLNAFITDNFLIHNLKYTDKVILDYCENRKKISVKQGYTKCSILPVREKAIITNDVGINNILIAEDFDVLLLPPGDIILPGMNYGFIGGVGGMLSDNKMAFFGNLDNYCFNNEVKKFLNKYDVEPISLSDTKLIDRGSLFVL